MKNLKKLVAALLVLTFALAATGAAFAEAKFTEEQAAEGLYVEFKGTVHGYDKPRNSSKSKIMVKKGSIGLLTEIKGTKWAKVLITDGTMNAMGKSKELWFGTDKLEAVKDQDNAFIRVVFAAGGSGMSVEMEGDPLDVKYLKGKKLQTSGKVKLRKTPSLQGKCCGVVKKGVKLTCTGKLDFDSRLVVFFQVKYNGKKYFVSAEYLKNWEKVLMDAFEKELGI